MASSKNVGLSSSKSVPTLPLGVVGALSLKSLFFARQGCHEKQAGHIVWWQVSHHVFASSFIARPHREHATASIDMARGDDYGGQMGLSELVS